VARNAGIAIVGPPAVDVFGLVARDDLVDYLRDELRWGVANADQRYAVLNACRAIAYAGAGLLLSKADGGRWWLRRFGPEPLVIAALRAQEDGRALGPCSIAAKSFVAAAVSRLRKDMALQRLEQQHGRQLE
jgi:streptomycin 3"-adenylyltransferase